MALGRERVENVGDDLFWFRRLAAPAEGGAVPNHRLGYHHRLGYRLVSRARSVSLDELARRIAPHLNPLSIARTGARTTSDASLVGRPGR